MKLNLYVELIFVLMVSREDSLRHRGERQSQMAYWPVQKTSRETVWHVRESRDPFLEFCMSPSKSARFTCCLFESRVKPFSFNP